MASTKRFTWTQLGLATVTALGAGAWLAPARHVPSVTSPATSEPRTPAARSPEQEPAPEGSTALGTTAEVDLSRSERMKQVLELEEVEDPYDLEDLEGVLDVAVPRHEEARDKRSAFTQAVDLVQEDPTIRAALLSRYAGEPDERTRARMRSLLQFVTTDDVTRFATTMVTNSDPAQRREGFELLRQNTSSEARAAVRSALERETNGPVLCAALSASQPGPARLRDETTRTTARLSELSQSEDPKVRAEALGALVRWDRSSALEGALTRALDDRDGEVRQAAMIGIVESGLRSDQLKTELLALAGSGKANQELRLRAIETLDGFALSAQEHTAVSGWRQGLQERP